MAGADGTHDPVGGTVCDPIRLEADEEVPGTHPVGEVNGGQLGGMEVPGCL